MPSRIRAVGEGPGGWLQSEYAVNTYKIIEKTPMTTTFADIGVSEDLCAALQSRGITEPFSIQSIAIPDALAGRDVCGKAKTGSGKTLAFGIPVVEKIGRAEPKRPLAIALVPTRELAVQVAEELEPLAKSRDVRIAAVYGGANIERQITRLEKGVDFVVATPGRMIDLVERKAVSLERLTHVIVDEADRMADCLLYTSPSPRDQRGSRMPSSA